MSFKTTFFSTGYTTTPGFIAQRGKGLQQLVFHATVVLIEHPTEGLILFDTGYAPRIKTETRKLPESIYALATPFFITAKWSIVNQLKLKGIEPNDIQKIVISHFHGDHIGGLKDFPQSSILCSKAAWEMAKNVRGLKAVSNGIITSLIPKNINSRMAFFEDLPQIEAGGDFNQRYSFSDNIEFIHLPGHARGQFGLMLKKDGVDYQFLVADAFWLTESIETNTLPSKLTKLFIDSWPDYVQTFRQIQLYRKHNSHVDIRSCHCPRTYKDLVVNKELF